MMKSIYKFFGIAWAIVFLLLPLTANAQEPVWTQDLNLNTSTASAIAQVEDGIIVLQYGENATEESNLLIKYDFDGQKIWEIPNTYGYNIESVSDGFIVWQETKITKFDKDKNLIWSTDIEFHTERWYDYGGLGNTLAEVSGGYVICSQYDNSYKRSVIYIDNTGNIKRRIAQSDLLKRTGTSYVSELITITQSLDDNNIIIVSHEYYTGVNNVLINIFDQDLNFKKAYVSSLIDKDNINTFGINNMVETDNSYIMYGKQILVFNKSGILINILDKISLDMQVIGDYLFSYNLEQPEEDSNIYRASLVKYDKDMKEISKIELPLTLGSFYIDYQLGNFNKIVPYNDDDQLNIAVLNTPITLAYAESDNGTIRIETPSTDYLDSKYQLINYRFDSVEEDSAEDSNKKDDSSGIIVNIIKNPQTNSIIIIGVFVALILIVSALTYLTWKKKNNKEKNK